MSLLTRLILTSLIFSAPASAAEHHAATFAGGCFWCMEAPFEKLKGVHSVISGYTGGSEPNPNYQQVARGETGHTEAVQITYDPEQISYAELLNVFWRQIDPTVDDRQFVDRGRQYRPGIFYHTEQQRLAAEQSKAATAALGLHGKPFKLEITQASTFWPAEDYHQDYYKKNPLRYHFYRFNSGRDQYLEKIWGKQRRQ